MLLRDDDDEECSPVAEDAQEVGQDLGEVLAAGDTCDGIDHEGEEHPEEAGHHGEGAAERLNGEASRVGVRDVVGTAGSLDLLATLLRVQSTTDVHNGEREQNEDELSSALPWGEHLTEKATGAVIREGVNVGGIGDGHKGCAEDFNECNGNEEAEEREDEHAHPGRVCRETAVVICSHRRPLIFGG